MWTFCGAKVALAHSFEHQLGIERSVPSGSMSSPANGAGRVHRPLTSANRPSRHHGRRAGQEFRDAGPELHGG
jgi:hypothetical protein